MIEVADYCRQVEDHLTKVNGGHLVRVVGPGFALVKQWADEGVPLSVVFRGIENKAERHAAGASRRPLRIEFCEADVRSLYDDWRRAIGVWNAADSSTEETSQGTTATPRRKSVPKMIDRAIARLGRLAGRLELPGDFRDAVSGFIERLAAIREELSQTRGAARDRLLEQVPPLERDLLDHARRIVPPDVMQDLTSRAEIELAPYKTRLSSEAWARAIAVTVDRGIGEYLQLPSFNL